MKKFILPATASLWLAGCYSDVTVEDNSPGKWERRKALEYCTGEHSSFPERAPTLLRLLCIKSVYGGL